MASTQIRTSEQRYIWACDFVLKQINIYIVRRIFRNQHETNCHSFNWAFGFDAIDMANALKKLNFEIIKAKNADFREMRKAINQFSRSLKNGDVALFFFAGHGIQVDGENYLMPINSRIDELADVTYESMPIGRILRRMEDAKSMNIIILDACRNNPLGRGFSRSMDRGLARVARAPEGSIIAYATAPGKTAADGNGRNGLFTSALLNSF